MTSALGALAAFERGPVKNGFRTGAARTRRALAGLPRETALQRLGRADDKCGVATEQTSLSRNLTIKNS